MCTYLAKRGSTYYFRRPIPLELRPAFDGKAEFMVSLRTKDRQQAKRLIPAHTEATESELDAARVRLARAMPRPSERPAEAPVAGALLERAKAAEALLAQQEADRLARREARQHLKELWRRRLQLSTAELDPEEAALKDLIDEGRGDLVAIREGLERYEGNIVRSEQQRRQPAQQGDAVWLDTTVVDRWAAERQVRPKSKDAHRAVARWFYERVGHVAVKEITRKDVIAFKDALLEEGQSPQNINTKLSRLRTLLGYAMQNDLAASNAAHGINIVGSAAAPRRRLPFELADLQAIFDSPVFAQGARPIKGKGEAAYWLPLLALFTGARMEELGQLRPSDVQRLTYHDADGAEHASWFLRITTLSDEGEAENQLKNEESERLVPVHAELKRLGFIEYVEGAKKAGHARVFPKLKPGAYDRLTAKWGEWFGPYLRKECGISDRRKVFHSFRHTFKDIARHCGMGEGVQRQIMGHSGDDVADDYGKGHSLYRLVEGMAVYRIAGLNLPTPTTGII